VRKRPTPRARPARRAAQAAIAAAAETYVQRPVKRAANRRVVAGRGPARRAPVHPMDRKVRNRTILLLTLLALVNAYVFMWREGSSLLELGAPRPAVIAGDDGPAGALGSLADPREVTCGGDPVRVFDGLHDAVHQSTTLAAGRTLRLALIELGAAGPDIDALEAAIRPSLDLGLLVGSNAAVRAAMDRDGGVLALELEQAEGRLVQACRDGAGLRVRTLQHPPVSDIAAVRIELGDDADLVRAVTGTGERPELADLIAEALAFDVDLVAEAEPRDKIEVLVERRSLGQHFHRYGALVAVRFRGAAGRFTYFRHQPAGTRAAALYDAEGRPQRRSMLRTPVRFHPIAHEARAMMPPSVEIVAGKAGALYRRPEGAPVVALGDGAVRLVEETDAAGRVVEVELADGVVARYAHLHRVVGDLRPGSEVRQGQILGLAGHTGKTATDRVRLELRREHGGETTMLDPLSIVRSDDQRPPVLGAPLTDKALDRFKAEVVPWQRALRHIAG
jgi:murein DD-endopeptidase MepM/ murein hydrolase activator NlpD